MALKYQLDQGFGGAGRFGLIVLSTDESLENEARMLFSGHDLCLLHSRIPAQPDVTPKSLASMENHMTATAERLPRGLDVIGYGCTSGATVIGPDRVAELVREAHPEAQVTNPMTSVIAALKALKANNIVMITPYVESVNEPMIGALNDAGIAVARQESFLEEDDYTVARIAESSTLDAMINVAKTTDCDAIFASCTNLRSFGIIERAEAETGLPVISSNLAFLWHMLKLAGTDARGWWPGQLFEK